MEYYLYTYDIGWWRTKSEGTYYRYLYCADQSRIVVTDPEVAYNA